MTECIFGWGRQHGTIRKTKHRGIDRVAADLTLNLIAYNLIRIPKLVAAQPPGVQTTKARQTLEQIIPTTGPATE
jgi:hypothetical protein